MSRLYNILGKMVVKKKTVTLTPTSYQSAGTALTTNIPLTKPIVAVYTTNRDGWRLFPTRDHRWSDTYWLIQSTIDMSGSYDLVIYYLDYDL